MDPREIAQNDRDNRAAGTAMYFLENVKEHLRENDKPESDRWLRELIAHYIVQWHDYAWVGDVKGEYRKFYKGAWRGGVDVSVSRLVREYCRDSGLKLTAAVRDDIRLMVKEALQLAMEDFNTDRNIVNFTNGYVALNTRSFHNHPSEGNGGDFLFTVQVPHHYKPGLTPLKFLPWLWATMEGDGAKVDLLLKAAGYALTLSVKYQKLFMIKGGPRTGKSTFLNILHALVGVENSASVPLQRLAKRFGTSGILGKVLNYHADIPTNKAVSDTSQIKTLVDDTIDVEIKGGVVGATIKNITKHFFSTNRMPPVRGLDLAYARRWIIVNFDNTIAEGDVIGDYEGSIIDDPDEMAAIVSLAMDAFFDLEDDGRFKAQSPEDVLEMIMEETDTVYRFLKHECDVDPSFSELQDNVYTAYTEYAVADGALEVLKKAGFTSDLYSKGFGWARSSQKIEGKRPYTYTGLKLKPEDKRGERPNGKPALFRRIVSASGIESTDPLGLDFEKIVPEVTLEDACREEIERELAAEEDDGEFVPPPSAMVFFDEDDED